MALRNARWASTGSWVTIYTTPSGRTARVIHAQVAGMHDPSAPFSLRWTDASNGHAEVTLADQIPIPNNSSVEVIMGELVLESGDRLQARSDGTNRLNLSVSVDEN